MAIEFFDTTLRDGEQAPGNTMEPENKLRIALALEAIGVDVIEAGFPASSREDFDACQMISESVGPDVYVGGLSRCHPHDMEITRDAFKYAKRPMIQLFLPGSDSHIDVKFGNRARMIDIMEDSLKSAGEIFPGWRVFFGIEDSSRADRPFLGKMIDIAADNGIKDITLADTVGHWTPEEAFVFTHYFVDNYPDIRFGIHCHNDLGNATANTLAAVKAGVHHVQTTVNGIGERAGNTAFEQVVANLVVREDYYGCGLLSNRIQNAQITQLSQLVSSVVGRAIPFEQPVVGKNTHAHGAGIHQSGIMKNRDTYEQHDPAIFGGKMVFVEGRHSGNRDKFANTDIPVVTYSGPKTYSNGNGYV